jgi:Caspase domain
LKSDNCIDPNSRPAKAPGRLSADLARVHACTETRVALVIGNGKYANGGRLPNPKNDADKFAATLKRIGFSTVTLQLDLTRAKLYEALKSFAGRREPYVYGSLPAEAFYFRRPLGTGWRP